MGEESFHVIISDLQMPGVTGLKLLKQVHKKYPRSTFLMTTAVDDVRVGVQTRHFFS